MIKNLAPLTYNKSFWLRHDDLSYNCFFVVPLEPDRCDRKKRKTAKKKKTSVLPSNFYCIYSSDLQPYLNRKLFRVTVSGDQNVKKDGENLRSKLTNRQSFLRGPRFVCFLRRKLCVFTEILLVRYKKIWHPLFSINMFIGSFFFISIRFK